MQLLHIAGNLGAKGTLDIKEEELFGLKPGTRLMQIGDGRENGTIRTDRFSSPLTYRGSVFVEWDDYLAETMYAFEVDTSKGETCPDGEQYYLLYGKTKYELFTEHRAGPRAGSYMRWYKPVFK